MIYASQKPSKQEFFFPVRTNLAIILFKKTYPHSQQGGWVCGACSPFTFVSQLYRICHHSGTLFSELVDSELKLNKLVSKGS